MRILVLSNKMPYPPRDGGSIATLNMLRSLREAGNEVWSLAMNTSKHPFPVDHIPGELKAEIRFLDVNYKSRINPLGLFSNFLFSTMPYISERFNTRSYRLALERLLKNETFDIIQLEGPYLGHYIDTIREFSGAGISYRAHNVEHHIWRSKAMNSKFLPFRLYLANMSRRLEKFELDVARKVDYLVSISENDRAYFLSRGVTTPSLTVSTGLDMEKYPPTPIPPGNSIFYIGALDWLPNQEGLKWFLDRVFPLLKNEVPGLEFHVAGRNAPESVRRLLNDPSITYHGEVDSAIEFMQKYRLMVVPLLSGSGIRIKILEGMALGRPVVTTGRGIEGIPAEIPLHVRVADKPEEFKKQVIELLSDDAAVEEMTARARELIQRNFDTFELSKRIHQFLNNSG